MSLTGFTMEAANAGGLLVPRPCGRIQTIAGPGAPFPPGLHRSTLFLPTSSVLADAQENSNQTTGVPGLWTLNRWILPTLLASCPYQDASGKCRPVSGLLTCKSIVGLVVSVCGLHHRRLGRKTRGSWADATCKSQCLLSVGFSPSPG